MRANNLATYMTRNGFIAICFVCFLIGGTGRARGDASKRLTQYSHTVWRVQDGYFGGSISAVTQTKDGYIWVGTENGLYKFDGVNFVRWAAQSGEELPASAIMTLRAARDGSLWIGTRGGLARIINNRLMVDHRNDGWLVWKIFEDRDGKIWFSRDRPDDRTHPICRVLDSEFRCYGSEDGFEASSVLAEDASGDLWMGGSTTLVQWRPGVSKVYRPQALRSNAGNGGVVAVLPAADSSLWVGMLLAARGAGLQRLVKGTLRPFLAPKLNGETLAVSSLLGDYQNNVWVGTAQGLYRIRGIDVDHYGSENGLSGDNIGELFEDREGDLWVVTSQGLDMFRELRVKTISKRDGLNLDHVVSVAASRDGSVWIGTDRLQVLGAHGISLDPGKGLPGDQITSIFEDHAGRLWVGAMDKLFVRERGSFRQVTRLDGSALGWATGITEDSEHNIWVETGRIPGRSLVQIQNMKVTREFPAAEMPVARKIVADSQGGIWLGLLTGDLARYRDGQVNTFTFGDHPHSGVLAIIAGADGSILGGTDFGVVGWRDGKQQVLTRRNGLPCNSVPALNSDGAGNLWLYAQCGLIEIPKEEMQEWWNHPDRNLNLQMLDSSDGVQPGVAPYTSSAKTLDGRLWFANNSVAQVIDPAHMRENTVAPPVDISAVVADHKAYPLESAIHLPPLTRDVEIDYTALSFVSPQKVHFRYRLEGHDDDWQEPGTRRQAFYNDLPPRRYRFRVIACNNDGVWNEEGAFLDFSISPAYYQTRWFQALCVAAFLALLWAVYQLRLRQMAQVYNLRLDERVDERTRIARELHDTLLQTLHGLMFQFQAVRNLLPRRPDEAMQSLDDAISETEKALAESRDAIQGLRSEPIAKGNLAEMLMAASQELANSETSNHEPPAFKLIEEGERRTLSHTTKNEVCRIALEILRNSYRHARAHRIEAEVRYGEDALRVRIRDNGTGIDPKVLRDGGIAGHWGLRGIYERAMRIGAQLDFWSEAAAGTEVQLTLPASVAYETGHDGARSKLLRKVRNGGERS